jgi:oxygen-dependent protoporphyrinogen oxidase
VGEDPAARRLVVVGAGISGLAAAHGALARWPHDRPPLAITLLERESVVGGKALSHRDADWLVEEGPTGYLDAEPALDRLVAAAGLEKLPADRAAAHRFIVRGGRMREVAAHPVKFFGSGILGPGGIARLLCEPLVRGKRDEADESVWQFGARRLGRQAADRLIAPMVLGVFAGDAKRLSLPAAFPKMATMERQHGSLVRALIARRRSGQSGGGPAGPAGWLTSFGPGLQELPAALARDERLTVRTGCAVRRLEPRGDGGYTLELERGERIDADAIVLSGEPWASAETVREMAPSLAGELDAIDCPPVAVVGLGYAGEAMRQVPEGFGVLIPRGEGFRILGCLWDSRIFPDRAPETGVLVRAMLGGAVDREAGELTPDELVATTRRDLRKLLGIEVAPVYEHVVRWPRAIPQYELGHLERVARIERELAARPGLFMAGNALTGIAFAKAAARGLAMGEAAADHLGRTP